MKKEKKVKCPICGTYNEKMLAVFHNKRYYCKICYEGLVNEKEYYNQLYDYICEIYEIDALNGWMFKQIKEFKDKYNYSYRGMKTTLHYFYEILGNDVADAVGVGIIPFVYDEAKQYYIDKKKVSDSVKSLERETLIENKTIEIKKQDIKDSVKYKEVAILDISDLV